MSKDVLAIEPYMDSMLTRVRPVGEYIFFPGKDDQIFLSSKKAYDLFEDHIEQQTLSHAINDYYPIVFSKNVSDVLLRNGYKKKEFTYAPELVLRTLSVTAAEHYGVES